MRKCIIALLVLCACFYGAAIAIAAESVIFEVKDPTGGQATAWEGLTNTQQQALLNLIGLSLDEGSVVYGGTFTYNTSTVRIAYQGMLLLWNAQTSGWENPESVKPAAAAEVAATAARSFELTDSSPYNQSTVIGKIKMTYADASTEDKGDSSSGCSAFAVGSLALLLVPMAFWGSKKKAA